MSSNGGIVLDRLTDQSQASDGGVVDQSDGSEIIDIGFTLGIGRVVSYGYFITEI